jgi:hypothetical protein
VLGGGSRRRSGKGAGSERLARTARSFAKDTLGKQSWHKIPDWLTNYNWTEVQAGLTEGQASAGGRLNFESRRNLRTGFATEPQRRLCRERRTAEEEKRSLGWRSMNSGLGS